MALSIVDDCLLSYPELRKRGIPFSRAYLRRLEHAGKFPKRIALGEKRVAWWSSQLDSWIAAKTNP